MCAEVVTFAEGAASTMLETQRGSSQGAFSSGMGSVDEEISAMLQSSHSSITQASLAGVMAPASSSTGTDLLTSFSTPYSSFQGSYPAGGLSRQAGPSRTITMPHRGVVDVSTLPPNARPPPPPPQGRTGPPPQRWAPYNGDEKWVMEAKSGILEAAATRVNTPNFGAIYENCVVPGSMNPQPHPGALHRYHSAPSTFLQSLSELDAFSQVPTNPAMSSLFIEGGLTPITEQMDVDRIGSGDSCLNDFDQFLSPESDFSRRAALSALGKTEANADTFGTLFPPSKRSLVRQNSSPVAKLAQPNTSMQDRIDGNGSEESSSRTSEDNNALANGLKASMYSQDEYLLRDTMEASWKSPTSPDGVGGKRQRGVAGESDTSSGSAEGSITYRHGQNGGLVRHLSLPTNTDHGPTSPGFDDHSSYGTVQMRTRAKRGCATHPRSIAERVRRTRISERMKKLQDLVPSIDKQSNTSDMLDETVEYVKSLQRQVRELTETVAQLKAAQQKSS